MKLRELIKILHSGEDPVESHIITGLRAGVYPMNIRLTSVQAGQIIDAMENIYQRPLKNTKVRDLARAMAMGDWRSIQDPIRIGVLSFKRENILNSIINVNDGQHRLMALSMTPDAEIEFLLTFKRYHSEDELEADAIQYDTSKPRTNREKGIISGVDLLLDCSQSLASKYIGAVEHLTKIGWDQHYEVSKEDHGRPSVQDAARRHYAVWGRQYLATIAGYGSKYEGTIQARKEALKYAEVPFLVGGILSFMVSPSKAEPFWTKVSSGLGINKDNDPAKALREYFLANEHTISSFKKGGKPLFEDKGPGSGKQRRKLLAITIAWNHYMRRKGLKFRQLAFAVHDAYKGKTSSQVDFFGLDLVDPKDGITTITEGFQRAMSRTPAKAAEEERNSEMAGKILWAVRNLKDVPQYVLASHFVVSDTTVSQIATSDPRSRKIAPIPIADAEVRKIRELQYR